MTMFKGDKLWSVNIVLFLLVGILGCAEAAWIAKKVEEYEKQQAQKAQGQSATAGGPEFSERLEKLPEGIQFPPDSLKGRVSYDAYKQQLVFKGAMKETERDELLNLSEDPSYKETIKRLYLSTLPAGTKAVEIPVISAHTVDGKTVALEKPLGPHLVLKDGSKIKGGVKGEVTFHTELATLKVKGEDILSFSEGTLKLRDGTVLKGTIQQESLTVHTDYGELQAKVEDVVSITAE